MRSATMRKGALGKRAAAFALTLGLLASQAHGDPSSSASSAAPRLIFPETGAYNGAYVDFGEYEDTVTLEAIEGFDAMVGKQQALIGHASFWGRGTFPDKAISIVDQYGAVSLIYWNPFDGHGSKDVDRFRLERILSGEWDAYIDRWAQGARAFGKPLLVSWGLEMNGNWFPWCGIFAGGGEIISNTNPPQYRGPETFKKAYRYVVDRVRKNGASNILWLFHPNNTADPAAPWNTMAAYYPGDEYVDVLALSAYGKQYPGPGWETFSNVLPAFYQEIMAINPSKPFILAEWGIGEFPKQGDKGAWLHDAFDQLSKNFPRLKGMVFWHERWQNGDLSYSNLRVHSSIGSKKAYRAGLKSPFWISRPRFQ